MAAKNFATSYVENLGNGQFKITSLPVQAQFAPIYGILINDFNSDGNLDVLLAGNFYGTRVKYGRYDADKGTLLLGDGSGNFRTTNSSESGLNINGEVRDIKLVSTSSGPKYILFARNNETMAIYGLNP